MTEGPYRRMAVIPAHDEGKTIAKVVLSACRFVDRVLVVDDGSHDDTAARAQAAGAQVLSLRTNRGKGGALRAGLDAAVALGAELIVTLDADGEHDPEEIPKFLAMLENADVVLGARNVFRSKARGVLNWTALFWFRLLDPAICDTICGFRGFRAATLPQLQSDAAGFAYEHEVILAAIRAGLRLETVAVSTTPRQGSHVTILEMVRANNHFDRWILRHLGSLRVSAWRKLLLGAGCSAGLVLGTPVEWLILKKGRAM